MEYKKYYKVTANRYGNPDDHSYVCCICDDRVLASILGKYHCQMIRGGKYEPHVEEFELDGVVSEIYILSLFNGDRENLISYPFISSSQARHSFSQLPKREHFALDLMLIDSTEYIIRGGGVKVYLDYPKMFTEEENKKIADLYEKHLKHQDEKVQKKFFPENYSE